MSVNERVYKSADGIYDNPIIIGVTIQQSDGTADMDWVAGLSSIECILQPAGVTVTGDDTSNSPIQWYVNPDDAEELVITIDFAAHDFGQAIITGMQRAKLVAHDSGHPNGQILAHRDGEDNKLNIFFLD